MMLRFSQENWAKFQQGKKTTTRFKRLKDGVYDAVVGSRFKPKVVGKVKIRWWYGIRAHDIVANSTDYYDLSQQEVFHCSYCLFAELMRLNPKKSPHDMVYVHKAEVVK